MLEPGLTFTETLVGFDTTISSGFVPVSPFGSVTWTVKLYVPSLVGVPVIDPVVARIVSPGGSVPEAMANAYGELPPLTLNTALQETPTFAAGNSPVITRCPELFC